MHTIKKTMKVYKPSSATRDTEFDKLHGDFKDIAKHCSNLQVQYKNSRTSWGSVYANAKCVSMWTPQMIPLPSPWCRAICVSAGVRGSNARASRSSTRTAAWGSVCANAKCVSIGSGVGVGVRDLPISFLRGVCPVEDQQSCRVPCLVLARVCAE